MEDGGNDRGIVIAAGAGLEDGVTGMFQVVVAALLHVPTRLRPNSIMEGGVVNLIKSYFTFLPQRSF